MPFFPFGLDPGTGSSVVHWQDPWCRAPYACLHCPVWGQTFCWYGDNPCQHCEDGEESAVSQLHLLSHEVPEQEHPTINVRHQQIKINKSTCGCSLMKLFFCCWSVFSAAPCKVGIKLLNPQLRRLSLRFSRAIQHDIYLSNSKASVTSSTHHVLCNIDSLVKLPQIPSRLVLLQLPSTLTALPAFCPELSWPRSWHMFLERLLMLWR